MTTPYVDPQTVHNPSTGGSPPASWGDTVRNGLESAARPPGCFAHATSNTSFTHNTVTPMALNGADIWDTDNMHSPSTNNTRMTVPAGMGGLWRVTAQVGIQPHATGVRQMIFRENGSSAHVINQANPAPIAYNTLFQGTRTLVLAAGTYIELCVWQDSGATLVGNGWLEMQLIAWA